MNPSPKPPHQRPELPEFWDKRFREAVIPWRAQGVGPELVNWLPGRTPGRALVPGCGHGEEAAFLARAGWAVTALDFSPEAVAAARATLGDWSGHLVCDDFFTFTPPAPFDLVVERAFLCALPRRCWADYGPRLARLIRPGGHLVGWFVQGDEPKGPPFGLAPDQLEKLLGPAFRRLEQGPSQNPVPLFGQGESWQVWERLGD